MAAAKTTVSLVLGSGGARGLAHIGIIGWLEDNGYEIRSISGCSMGALIGGIYACGKLDTYTDWVRAVDEFDIVRLLDLSWSKAGLFDGEKIIRTLKELIGDRRIEELPIRFTAVAADISREKEVWITQGSVFDAIRASISLPLFFTPVMRDQETLLDGGILNPVPIAPTFEDKTDLTIAVNLGGRPIEKPEPPRAPKKPRDEDGKDSFVDSLHDRVTDFIDDLTDSEPDEADDWEMMKIATATFDSMQSTIARQKLAAYPPDHTIVIPRNACGMLEFDRADEMIELGRRAAAEQMPRSDQRQ
ncbi:MAG: patatin-like phospholipase family protein [Gammaproteobacteria bacterium]